MHDRTVHVIGIDWAASDEGKCGLALGQLWDGALGIEELLTGREAEFGQWGNRLSRGEIHRSDRTHDRVEQMIRLHRSFDLGRRQPNAGLAPARSA